MTTFKTWEEMSDLEQSRQIWWEAFKDAHGFRPRDIDISEWSLEKLNEAIEQLGKIIRLQEDARDAQQAVAVVVFELRIKNLIDTSGKDRAAAIALIHEEEGSNGDGDYLCYLVGIPYGYFDNKTGA